MGEDGGLGRKWVVQGTEDGIGTVNRRSRRMGGARRVSERYERLGVNGGCGR